ncbi:MAG TPA: UDP-N-acetylmuramate dehydrogenase [Xanthomonadaceae bacterium]|jgi:UDP-N-acetylmuramate dehydrogenase
MPSLRLLENAPLEARNTFRVPARAELLAEVRDRAALDELLGYGSLRRGPLLVLGEGSNLLLAGDPPGLVVHLDLRGIAILDQDDAHALVRAEAGVGWNDFVHWTLGQRLEGLENLALIPGHVGAAPIQNIGAYGSEVGEFIATVEAFDRASGAMQRLDHAACAFGYRDSVFKREPDRWIVVAVEFRLPRRHELRLDYAGIREELATMNVDAPRAAHVAEAVIRLRTRKLPNPALIGNAGSFFKNPQVDVAVADALRAEHPKLPVYPLADVAQRKLSAAWMIEACGWKGHREGDAGISAQHALVLVNHGHATGAQLLDLARRVAASVRERFGVAIEPEPRIVGATW